MKAILVIEMPDSYADRYNINEMYVWDMVIQDKNGYQMFDLTTDKPNHLKPMPKEEDIYEVGMDEEDTNAKRQWNKGWNACLEEIERLNEIVISDRCC